MKILKELLSENKVFEININWTALLAFAVFWSYGFYGTVQPQNVFLRILVFVLIAGIFLFFLYLGYKNDEFVSRFEIAQRDLYVFASYFLILGGAAFTFLLHPLVQDEIYHAQYSQLHSLFFIDHFSGYLPGLDRWPYWLALYGVNLLTLAGAIVFIWVISKISVAWRIFIYTIIFVALRLGVSILGSVNDPHPPFRLFPLWFLSSVFTAHAFVFHLAGILGLGFGAALVYWFVKKRLSSVLGYFFILAVFSIPLFLHVGSLVEQSVWTAVAWTLLIFAVADENSFQSQKDFFIWFSAMAIATMLRQSAFLGFVPLGLLYLNYLWQNRRGINFIDVFLAVSPALVMLPFLAKSIIVGTPASYVPGEAAFVPPMATVLQRVAIALKSGIAWGAAFNSLGYYLMFLPLCFLCTNKKQWLRRVVLLVFFAAAFVTFYSIRPTLWGMGRYQAEFVLPFVIFGFYQLLVFIATRLPLIAKPAIIVLGALVIFNIYVFNRLPQKNPAVDGMDFSNFQQTKVISEFVYNYGEALAAAKKSGLAGKTYIFGVSYGVFSQIMNNYTVAEVRADKNIYENFKNSREVEFAAEDKNFRLILLSDLNIAAKKAAISNLQILGFSPWQNFYNPEYRSTIIGLIR